MKKRVFYKYLVIGLSILLICTNFFPSIGGNDDIDDTNSIIAFYIFDRSGTKKCISELSKDTAEEISEMFEELKEKIISDPYSDETITLKEDFIDLLNDYDLIPNEIIKNDIYSYLNPKSNKPICNDIYPLQTSYSGSAFFCSIAGGGSGFLFPPIMFPRPRLLTTWAAFSDSITIASNLYTGRGFAAGGSQFGIAVGFWGIGLSFAFPGEPAYFGFGGYALAAFVGAQYIETYPPNQIPTISEEQPPDGSENIPNSLSELRFRIKDLDGDLMDYTVTTYPDIGSGSGSNVIGGTYSIPVSGLNSNTEYTWRIIVSDSEDITEKTFSFRTEIEAPFVTDPSPINGDNWVPIDLSKLSIHLEDLQDDLMDYSIETVPDIGNGTGTGVGNGIYSINVGGLDNTKKYSWFVNVTDGEYWTRRIFNFKTQPIMVFNPFEKGWLYRKKITIDHTKVIDNLNNFPVLISLIDSDLASKAQNDGDDILFMDGSGEAKRLLHEIEGFYESTGKLISWVNLESLSGSSNTILYLYYGNPNCDSQQYPTKVWDPNYAMVHHMIDKPNNMQITDSTENKLNGLKKGPNEPNEQVGIIGLGQNFDGIDDHIFVDHDQRLDAILDNRTYEVWVTVGDNFNSGEGDGRFILSKQPTGDREPRTSLAVNKEEGVAVFLFEGSKNGDTTIIRGNTDIRGDTCYITAIRDRDSKEVRLYLNGKEDTNSIPDGGQDGGNSGMLCIGDQPSVLSNGRVFKDIIDEVRVSTTVRSDAWIKTSFNTMNNPSSFFTIGPEESGP